MYSPDEVERVLALDAAGLNKSQISRATGVSRAAIRAWLRGEVPGRAHGSSGPKPCVLCDGEWGPFPQLTGHAYAYLLGMYLGDGCLSASNRGVYRLRIFLDRTYPVIVAECAAAMAVVMPASQASVYPRSDEHMDVVSSYSQHWPCVFPQHGSGPKHRRNIELTAWQREVVDRHPARLLRGLVHSDGCGAINTIKHPRKTYRYPRYQFSNRSADIRAIFCEYCDRLGIEWRRMNRYNISVARAESVARLDRVIGPKR